MNAARQKPRYDAPAVRTALRILEVLCTSGEPLGVSEISRAIDQNKSLTFRLLSTLRDEGWVAAEEPGPRYRVTLVPFKVFAQSVGGLDIRTAAAGPLHALWDEWGESVYLAVLHDDASLYLEHLDSRQSVRIAGMVGGSYPLHSTAPGKVLLAYGGEALFQRICAQGLPRATKNTLTTAKALQRDLAAVRRRGWSCDNEEFARGVLCFAAPIFDHHGACVATIGTSVTTLGHTLDSLIERIGPAVCRAAQETSHLLGNVKPEVAAQEPREPLKIKKAKRGPNSRTRRQS